MIDRYLDKWDWKLLFNNESLLRSEVLIDKYLCPDRPELLKNSIPMLNPSQVSILIENIRMAAIEN